MVQKPEFLEDADIAVLERHGISLDEASRQWDLLSNKRQHLTLQRACTPGDGIERIKGREYDSLIRLHGEAAAIGRWSKFVPASGAATRMFSLESGEERRRFCKDIARFAFFDKLQQILSRRGMDVREVGRGGLCDVVVATVLGSEGLGYGDYPKGLVEFHRYDSSSRTPFEEHLLESSACFPAADDTIKVHFTVTEQYRTHFEDLWRQLRAGPLGGRCDVSLSVQENSSDTLAIDSEGRLLRDSERDPVLRPGGHGALIENLNALKGDLVFVKNIDNVSHEDRRGATIEWAQILGGYLCCTQSRVHQHIRALISGDQHAVSAACEFVRATFPGISVPPALDDEQLRAALIDGLSRPLRICGMVRNEGEPGGGPFWVHRDDGSLSPQIVEIAEVDKADESQKTIVQSATHFNPVFMALAVRDHHGQPFELKDFVDPGRSILTDKSVDGSVTRVLERPGLWNGAMANWNTVFVEVPVAVFSPVKTVFDLLRAEHQPLCFHEDRK
jgi:hypothetical protein